MGRPQILSQQYDVNLKIDKLEGQRRHILAKIEIPYSLEQVWQIITDYESFSEFIPNMTQSRRIEHPTGGIRLEQIRTKSLAGIKVSARSVVDIRETYLCEVHYQLIEGDLREFSGFWRLETKSSSHSQGGVELIYDFLVLPKPIIPAPVFNHFLSNDIPAVLLAVHQRVESLFG
ncbi:SRPBCC family protein [Nodularia spumigena]|uniref:SRPBCC family protein n=1 Tax=Nodularia spumigena TaxID=70799 RepID=UPI00232D4E28|nr:SRPBCC family protein [Nodularia spumigena]MDB9318011.1 SRPBCC family protein [Nodularia spumigena CS-590/01A]MDB9321285.1 SRPBCC family protein [Nodularia spumigena CS-591/07A]MDB9325873.1 SRPBCC family protein [Nodularia spumigena CS-590/02]MDB9331772.1 SRPBCC family protein [Nodularia spumigena CS-591/04]MDB9337124.1 SRPBCC family protein [Nodularia spumigena CS-590/01]